MDSNDIVKSIADICPKFNDHALRGFIREKINNSPEFIKTVFEEGFKIVNADVELINYEILPPEEQVKFELRSGQGKNKRPVIPLTMSHLQLVRYRVRFEDKYIDSTVYTPYLYNDMLHINGKRSMIRKVILEKTLSRVSEKNKDGVTVSPIRVNLTFNRSRTHQAFSYITGEPRRHFIVSGNLYHGGHDKKVDITIMHYMLAKFGFIETLNRFGISHKDMFFVENVEKDTDQFDYFAANKVFDKNDSHPGLFLKVNKKLFLDHLSFKFVINVLYVINHSYYTQTLENVYIKEGSIWKVILGSITFKDRAEQKAYTNAETNLRSVDHFIDPITQKRFERFGIPIKDIYDLIVYVFINIDRFMVENVAQNLYNSRLDVTNGLLVESFARIIFLTKLYPLAKKSNIKERDIKAAVRLSPMMFKQSLSARPNEDKDYVAPADIIGDNYLFSGGLNKIRMGGKPEQRLHPSMVVVESINAFVGKTIGKTGYVNPFVPTDREGAIEQPDYAEEVEKIKQFLPR